MKMPPSLKWQILDGTANLSHIHLDRLIAWSRESYGEVKDALGCEIMYRRK